MGEYVFGANIIENLTTGMYQDSRVIYREYIQNACDQVDKAVRLGLLVKGEEEIFIEIDADARSITITDNATGIDKANFRRILSGIADSDKKLGEDKGFRGIGRLCGLAYCSQLIFSSTSHGEGIVSTMICDAEKMRRLINENELGTKHTAEDVLSSINVFSEEKTDDVEGHWFKVELKNINVENTALLDFKGITDYLSFVAPVPYKSTFIFRNEIYKHSEEIGSPIDEYNIYLNGEQVFKQYKTRYKTRSGEDEIFELNFKDFYDPSGNLIAWSWVGLSSFKGVIENDCLMRGIRLRKENIQIGDEDTLQALFKEDRGIHYFVGEVFAVSRDLIPNAQREYFNENPMRQEFERLLRTYFRDSLHKLYYGGSEINSAYKKIDDESKKQREFEERKRQGYYVDDSQIKKAEESVQKIHADAEKARKVLAKRKTAEDDETSKMVKKIIDHTEKIRGKEKVENEEGKGKSVISSEYDGDRKNENANSIRRADRLPAYSKNERKLISKIFEIILQSVDEETATKIIDNIEVKLK